MRRQQQRNPAEGLAGKLAGTVVEETAVCMLESNFVIQLGYHWHNLCQLDAGLAACLHLAYSLAAYFCQTGAVSQLAKS